MKDKLHDEAAASAKLDGSTKRHRPSTKITSDSPAEELRLRMGELTADEVRLVRAALKLAESNGDIPRVDVKYLVDILEFYARVDEIKGSYSHALEGIKKFKEKWGM